MECPKIEKPPTKPKARTTPAAGVPGVSAVQNPVLSTAAPREPAQITPPRTTGSASSSNVGTAISEKYSPRRTTYSTSPQETAGRAACPRPRSTVAPLQEAADRATCLRPSTTG
eukprot:gene4240-14353_t